MNSRLVASIDFGTNTARLLIARKHGNGSIEHVLVEREIVRMGGGFTRESGLSDDAILRGTRCLEHFSKILSGYEVSSLRAVATSAIRDANNGNDFIHSMFSHTGILLNAIDGRREGALTLAGVTAGLDQQHDDLMVFDVGGGSTEYTLARAGKAEFIMSLPLGVVRLTEGKTTPGEMSTKICKELDLLSNNLARSGNSVIPGQTILVGTAGTATTLAAIHLEMDSYDYRKVNNSLITLEEIRRIFTRLLPLSLEERITIPGLEKGREDLIIAGILITMHTMERFGFTELKISDYGLLEGLVVVDEF